MSAIPKAEQEIARHRSYIKRRLARAGVPFNRDDTTENLERQLRKLETPPPPHYGNW